MIKIAGILGVLVHFLWAGIDPEIAHFVPTDEEKKAGAVVIKKEVVSVIDSAAKQKVTTHILIAILSEEAARDYGQIELPYNRFYIKKKLKYARVIDTNGSVKELDKQTIQIRSPQHYNSYDDTEVIVFSLPSIVPGSFIEFEYVAEDQQNIVPHHASAKALFSFWQQNRSTNRIRLDPVRESRYTIRLPKELPLYFKTDSKAHMSVSEEGKMRRYSWVIHHIPREKLENGLLYPYDHFLPKIYYSTMKTWDILNDYFYQKYLKASVPDTHLSQLAKHITQGSRDPREKVFKLYQYIQREIKYIFAYLGRSGMFPHSATDVLQNKYGDCKDQTTLFIALLRAIGMEAYPALVSIIPDDFQADDPVSSKYFNHVVTYLPALDMFVDPTGFKMMFPGLSWSTRGNNSFVLNADQGSIRPIPPVEQEVSEIKAVQEVTDNKMKGEFHYFPSAQIGNQYKSFLANVQNGDLILKNEFLSMYQNVKVDAFDILNADRCDKPFEITWKISMDFGKEKQNRYLFSSMTDVMVKKILALDTLQYPEDRVHGFRFAFPVKLNIHSTYILPDETYHLLMDTLPGSFENKYYSYQIEHTEKKRTITLDESFETRQYKIPRSEYRDFYQLSKKILQDLNWYILVEKDKQAGKETQLIQEAQTSQKKIELAEYYLDNARYEESRKIIETLLKKEPNNGRAHYVYGIVLGYMDEYDKSDLEFQQAKNLGYEPKD